GGELAFTRRRGLATDLPLHVHRVAFDLQLIRGDVPRNGPAEELAGADVEASVVQRALDHVAGEVAGRERGAGVTADVAESVEVAADVHDQRPLAADPDALHRARRH